MEVQALHVGIVMILSATPMAAACKASKGAAATARQTAWQGQQAALTLSISVQCQCFTACSTMRMAGVTGKCDRRTQLLAAALPRSSLIHPDSNNLNKASVIVFGGLALQGGTAGRVLLAQPLKVLQQEVELIRAHAAHLKLRVLDSAL